MQRGQTIFLIYKMFLSFINPLIHWIKINSFFLYQQTLEQLLKCYYIKVVKNKNNIATCNIEIIDTEKISRVESILPGNDELLEVAETYKVLGDPTRLKMVLALSTEELCVCDLSALIGISISGISHQLRLLRNNRIVKYRREGKMAYYSLDDKHIGNIITEVLNHIKECKND